MLIPMYSLRDKAEKLFTIPLCFVNNRDAKQRLEEAIAGSDGHLSDFFDMAKVVGEFNPETGELFSLDVDVSAEFEFISADAEESEDTDEKVCDFEGPVTETFS